MEDFLGFPPQMAALLIFLGVAYFIMSWAPLWWPALLAYRHRSSTPRRWLFVVVVACLTYGLFVFFFFALTIPAQVYAIFIAPQWEQLGYPIGRPVLRVFRLIADYWWLVLPPVLLLTAWFVTRKLLRVWPRICAAVDG
jgi:hypothetical protein